MKKHFLYNTYQVLIFRQLPVGVHSRPEENAKGGCRPPPRYDSLIYPIPAIDDGSGTNRPTAPPHTHAADIEGGRTGP